jgi:hypothetical protein
MSIDFNTQLLNELECGHPWPSFVKCLPPEDHDQDEAGTGDTGE